MTRKLLFCLIFWALVPVAAHSQPADPTLQSSAALPFKPGGQALYGMRFTGAEPSFRRLWFGCDGDRRDAIGCRRPDLQLCIESCLADRSCVAWSAESQDPFGPVQIRTGLRCLHFRSIPPQVSRQITKVGEDEPFSCDQPGDARECALGVVVERATSRP
jgi:hypothetical protein